MKAWSVPHAVNLVIDLGIFIASIWFAYLLRFNFSIPPSELKPLPGIFILMVATRVLIAVATGLYKGIVKYTTVFDLLRIYLYTMLGSVIFILSNLVSYYLVNQTLFIPLTIIIIEFLLTSFLLLLARSVIRVSHTAGVGKEVLKRIRESAGKDA